MILVIGGTGTVGSGVVRGLQAAGQPFRALVRYPERSRTVLGEGVPLVVGDLARPDTLLPALEGVTRVFLATPVSPEQVSLQANLLEPARAQGVRHVVKLSNLGADPDSDFPTARWHGTVERMLEDSGLAWTHLRPHFFMQNLLREAPRARNTGVLAGAYGQGRISPIDARDVSACAVAALTDPRHENTACDLTGPEVLGFAEIAQALGEALGRPVRYEAIAPEAARERMMAGGLPDWYADALLVLFSRYAAGEFAFTTDGVERLTGRAATPLRQFLADHADALAG